MGIDIVSFLAIIIAAFFAGHASADKSYWFVILFVANVLLFSAIFFGELATQGMGVK